MSNNSTATHEDLEEIEDFIQGLRLKFPEEQYIVRGQSLHYGEKPGKTTVSSTLYRQLEHPLAYKKSAGVSAGELLEQEQKIVVATRQRSLPFITDIEVLSDLQHFGGPTNCIDFTKDIRIALFFACQKKKCCSGPGELIFLRHDTLEQIYPADFNLSTNGCGTKDVQVVVPSPTDMSKNRALFQHSLFIRHPEGCFDVNSCDVQEVEDVHKDLILSALSEEGVSHLSLFNDTFGLLDLGSEHEKGKWAALIDLLHSASTSKGSFHNELDEGILHYCEGSYPQAIKVFSSLSKGRGRGAEIYRLLGSAHLRNGDYSTVVEDINHVEQKSWNDGDCFLVAMAYYKLQRFECALSAINAAIDFNPYRSIYHHLRTTLKTLVAGSSASNLPVLDYMTQFLMDSTVERIVSEKIIKAERLNEDWNEDKPSGF